MWFRVFRREHIMTAALVWIGVALWPGVAALVVFGPSAGPVNSRAGSARTIGRDRA
jgi:hypothetical protein